MTVVLMALEYDFVGVEGADDEDGDAPMLVIFRVH